MNLACKLVLKINTMPRITMCDTKKLTYLFYWVLKPPTEKRGNIVLADFWKEVKAKKIVTKNGCSIKDNNL